MLNTIEQAEACAQLNRPTAILTPRGTAVAAVYTLLRALREFDADDRRDIRELLELELAEQLA